MSGLFTMPQTTSRPNKRLIVLCDGTLQDSTSTDAFAYPSNVTRLSRTIAPYEDVTNPDGTTTRIEQIVYYQKGLGTGTLDRLVAYGTGIGLSANVRAAYGFLAHNYEPGDQIYFFGFSRGAYTARAIAGLVTAHGLLTKKGMDSFSELYNWYYLEHGELGSATAEREAAFVKRLHQAKLIQRSAADAVEIVGVWDTVGFHKPGVSTSWIGKLIGLKPENFEFRNTEISPRVRYGFHALSLDDLRKSFLPTMWHWPKSAESNGVLVDAGKNGVATTSQEVRLEELSQVWFSGVHTDVGGGRRDHHLSDISLAWMIAKCVKTGLLAFDLSYLTSTTGTPSYSSIPSLWSTSEGPSRKSKGSWLGRLFGWVQSKVDHILRPLLAEADTHETIHASIASRKFGQNLTVEGAVQWDLPTVKGTFEVATSGLSTRKWHLTDGRSIDEEPVLELEEQLRGRIQTARNDWISSLAASHETGKLTTKRT